MKAYMSDVANTGLQRNRWQTIPSWDLAAQAEREAKRIRLDAEPWPVSRDAFNVGRLFDCDYSSIGRLSSCFEPHRCLAESLARFVALDLE